MAIIITIMFLEMKVAHGAGWMGENHFAPLPAAVYGFVLLMAAIAYFILQQRMNASQGEGFLLKKAVGNDWKGKLSPIL